MVERQIEVFLVARSCVPWYGLNSLFSRPRELHDGSDRQVRLKLIFMFHPCQQQLCRGRATVLTSGALPLTVNFWFCINH